MMLSLSIRMSVTLNVEIDLIHKGIKTSYRPSYIPPLVIAVEIDLIHKGIKTSKQHFLYYPHIYQ